MLYNTQITKALIRLRGCAGWSVPLLFACIRRQGFLRRGPFVHDKYPVAYASFCYKAVLSVVVATLLLFLLICGSFVFNPCFVMKPAITLI